MNGVVDVTMELQPARGAGEGPQALVKLQTGAWEFNVRAPVADLIRLRGVRQADWNARGSLAVGQCAGASVYWTGSGQEDQVVILVGLDDENWDLALTVPAATTDEIASLAAKALNSRGSSERLSE